MTDPEPFLFRQSTRQIVYGPGVLSRLGDIARDRDLNRAVIVIDGFFSGSARNSHLRDLLENAGVSVEFHGVPAKEPDTDSVTACHALLEQVAPDLVGAVGGGSTRDPAMVARMMLSNPGEVAELAGFDRRYEAHPSLFVCVPTTAGTASEVSEMAVVSLAGSDLKLRYRSQNMTAEIALLDPELVVSAPPAVTAATGFDALTHALESYVSKSASVMTDPLALDAMARIVRWLPVAYREPSNLAARGHCLIGSMLAGFVFNSTQLGLAHAIAAPLGALHHVVHGVANALALPAVMAFNEPCLGAKAEAIARVFGTATAAEGIAALRAGLDLDMGLDQVVATDAERKAIAVAAMKSGNIVTNPRRAGLPEVAAVLAAMREPLQGRIPRICLD